ncbi:MAG TPA: Stp1/IreP family PP2C-type Ser/Thr phosphatase [Solirubrobacterales bacterium]|nr:Stp1/IreP family PP2C-type Ser/Thr phosphatase [Solirubrobacterales bacterium]
MLRIVEEAARTDAGRQRRANEDSYYARAPAFAVADGMGGAQAGEVASQIAAESFEQRTDDGNPEQQLARVAHAANRLIFQQSEADSNLRGMGTTLTGALLAGDEVTIVHVGDSRAYLLRDGELRQLTRDHSLVEELRRQGRLTSEEAEEHPQRSVVTRALGVEPDVQLDVHTHQARSGDLFMLCSDGLTSMVRQDRLQEIVAGSDSLRAAADRLVTEANEMGGRDNITVVMFRLGGDEEDADAMEQTMVGAAPVEADTDTHEVPAAVVPPPSQREPEAPPPKRRRRRVTVRRAIATLVVLAVLAGIAVGAVIGVRQVYFVGQDERGLVTLYRGVPYELPLGIDLYDPVYVSSTPGRSLPVRERRRVLDHQLRSRDDAADIVRRLERGNE